jgi:hypothetical protein
MCIEYVLTEMNRVPGENRLVFGDNLGFATFTEGETNIIRWSQNFVTV